MINIADKICNIKMKGDPGDRRQFNDWWMIMIDKMVATREAWKALLVILKTWLNDWWIMAGTIGEMRYKIK